MSIDSCLSFIDYQQPNPLNLAERSIYDLVFLEVSTICIKEKRKQTGKEFEDVGLTKHLKSTETRNGH